MPLVAVIDNLIGACYMLCKNCGYTLSQIDNFCSKCGLKIDNECCQDMQLQDRENKSISGNTMEENLSNLKKHWFFSKTFYVVTWVCLFLSALAILLRSDNPKGGLGICFWVGCVTSISMKRKNRSGTTWFFIGFIPIGFFVYFVLVFLSTLLKNYHA
jgi:hypothetical protein